LKKGLLLYGKYTPYGVYTYVRHKRRKTNDSGNFAAKRQENGNSQRTKQHICKSHKPTHDQNLQKSCFLADAPLDSETFDVSCGDFLIN